MGCVKYLADHDAVKVVGECGTGKTFMAGAGVAYVAAHSKPFSTIVMCPPHLTEKWAREILIAVPEQRPTSSKIYATAATRRSRTG